MELLYDYIESRRYVPHQYGKNDCALFVADWYKIVTGADPAKGLRGYSTEKGAQRIINKHGGSLLTLLTERLGEPDKPLTACKGDIILGDYELGPACGICVGHAVALVSENGIELRQLNTIQHVWHVRDKING